MSPRTSEMGNASRTHSSADVHARSPLFSELYVRKLVPPTLVE